MYAVLLSAALFTADDQKAAPPAAGTAARPADAAVSLDGNWTVICLEKNGQPVAEAKNATVMVKGNIATFKKADGSDDKGMKAMRFDFGRNGQLYVMEANAEGKFENTGTDRRDNPAAQPAAGGTAPPPGTRPGDDTKFPTPPTASDLTRRDGSKAGVYVLTQDYLAVCIHDDAARTGSPGTDRPAGDRPADRPAAGAAGDRPAAGTDRTGGLAPQSKSYCTVVLKRAGGAAPQP